MKKDIVFYIPGLNIGGAERVLVNLVNALAQDFKILLVIGVGGGILESELNTQIQCVYLTKNRFIYRICLFAYAKTNVSYFVKILGAKLPQFNTSVLISYMDGVNTDVVLNAPIEFDRGYSVVQSNYITHSDKLKYLKSGSKKLRKRIGRRYNKQLQGVICASKSIKSGFLQAFPEVKSPVKVLYNVINSKRILDLDKNSCPQEIRRPEQDDFTFLAIGRVVEVKGYSLMITSFKRALKKNSNLKLIIVGDGNLREELTREVEQEGLSSRIVFTGRVKESVKYFNIADAYISTSLSEGLPTSICEAMIAGLPILGVNVSGINEVLDNGACGCLVEREEDAIVDGIISISFDKAYRESLRAKSLKKSQQFLDSCTVSKYKKLVIEG